MRRTARILAAGLLVSGMAGQEAWAQSATRLISTSSSGGEANGRSLFTAISEDGKFVVYATAATNVISNDGNGSVQDVILRDIEGGQSILISKSSAGVQANGSSGFPSLSADARRVAFDTKATNLLALDQKDVNAGLEDVFVHDRGTGNTILASANSFQEQGNGASTRPHISSDGRFVVFLSLATNLATGREDKNGTVPDAFLRDLLTEQTTIISIDSAGAQDPDTNRAGVTHAVVSKDGALVAFATDGKLITNDANVKSDVYLRDVQGGTTTVLSRSPGGGAAGSSGFPAMDPGGTVVAFESTAGLVAGVAAGRSHIYAFDLSSGTLRLVSRTSTGEVANGSQTTVAVSADGDWVSFVSDGDNLVPNDKNKTSDVFLHEISSGFTTRVSIGNGSVEANGPSDTGFFGVARNGSTTAFRSRATNLFSPSTVPDRPHVYVRTRVADTFPPVITCSKDLVLECEGSGGSIANFDIKVSDDSDPAPRIECAPPPGTTFPPGTTMVTCTATDNSRNTSSCAFKVTVTDTLPPSIRCPAEIRTKLAAGQLTVPVTFDVPEAPDACGGKAQVVCEPASGSRFGLGTTKVTCTAKDASNLTSKCEFSVVVSEGTPPVINCPADVELECDRGGGRRVDFNVTATDDSDPSPVVACVPASGSVFPVGLTKVACTATDSAGNIGTCSFNVRIADRTGPRITCPADITAQCSSPSGRRVDFNVGVVDTCDAAPRLECRPASGSTFPEGDTRVSCTATDASGNVSTCAFTVRVGSQVPIFFRGDANGDDRVTISDAVFILLYLFLGENPPGCLDAGDSDDNGKIDMTDPIHLLRFLFQSGPAPPAPGPDQVGPDPSADGLDCREPVC